jgi:hypothetical protein
MNSHRNDCASAVEEVKCSGCGKVIDPDWCHCGEAIAPNIVHDNHHPIPAGCDCFRGDGNQDDFSSPAGMKLGA